LPISASGFPSPSSRPTSSGWPPSEQPRGTLSAPPPRFPRPGRAHRDRSGRSERPKERWAPDGRNLRALPTETRLGGNSNGTTNRTVGNGARIGYFHRTNGEARTIGPGLASSNCAILMGSTGAFSDPPVGLRWRWRLRWRGCPGRCERRGSPSGPGSCGCCC